MAIRLTITDLREPTKKHVRGFVQDRVVIGRGRTCDICLPDLSISTMHMEIRLVENDYKAVDLGSLNSTTIRNKKLVAHRPKTLKNDDIVVIASYRIQFKLGVSLGPVPDKHESTEQARQMLASLLANSDSGHRLPALIVTGGPSKASRFELSPAPSRAVIGRGNDNDISLRDTDVSRRHAEIIYDNGQVTVTDLGSRNGIRIDGEKVTTSAIAPGQSFLVGKTTIGLEHPLDITLAKIQNAPEEETSSFTPNMVKAKRQISEDSLTADGKTNPDAPPIIPAQSNREPKQEQEQEREQEPERVSPNLPTGPADPLAYPGQPGYIKTAEFQKPSPSSGNKTILDEKAPLGENSDIGLILVGAILVAASVGGLIWLLT